MRTELLYFFNELESEAAKEKAREWWRNTDTDMDHDYMYEYFAEMGELLGIDLRTRPAKRMNGTTTYEPCIWWSGFWSQGDGACFEGSYDFKRGANKNDLPEELQEIYMRLLAVQKKYFYKLSASVKHSGHHYHEYCTNIEVFHDEDHDVDRDSVEEIEDCLRDFMRWMYKQLEAEYEYQTSDEVIDELLTINQYEFDSEGNHW